MSGQISVFVVVGYENNDEPIRSFKVISVFIDRNLAINEAMRLSDESYQNDIKSREDDIQKIIAFPNPQERKSYMSRLWSLNDRNLENNPKYSILEDNVIFDSVGGGWYKFAVCEIPLYT